MIYFVRKEDIDEGGRLWQMQLLLDKLNLQPVDGKPPSLPLSVPLTRDQLKWLSTDVIIANPHWRSHASGFRYIRREPGGAYAIRMSNREMIATIAHIRRHAAHAVKKTDMALEIVLHEKAVEEYIN